MDVTTNRHSAPAQRIAPASKHRWLGIALIALGLGLIANSLLGPFVADAIRYPLSESVLNQTTGLEAVSLLLVAPLCILAGVLAIRGRAVAPLVAFGPAAYSAYMFLQYVVGPEYRYYPRVLPMHLALFTLGGGIAVAAWSAIDSEQLPRMTRRSERRHGVLLLVLGAFIVSRYLPALFAERDDPLPAEFRADVSMYWSIFLLDLGVVVPATIAAALALIRGTDWGRKALYVVFGWFAPRAAVRGRYGHRHGGEGRPKRVCRADDRPHGRRVALRGLGGPPLSTDGVRSRAARDLSQHLASRWEQRRRETRPRLRSRASGGGPSGGCPRGGSSQLRPACRSEPWPGTRPLMRRPDEPGP